MKTLILVLGLPAVGKTTIAERISRELSAAILSTDAIRKRGLKKPSYGQENRELVYRGMLNQTKEAFNKVNTVILDATFSLKKRRELFYSLARELNLEVFIVKCLCKESVIFERIKKRSKVEGLSDVKKVEQYSEVKDEFEDLGGDKLPGGEMVKIVEFDTEKKELKTKNIDGLGVSLVLKKVMNALAGMKDIYSF